MPRLGRQRDWVSWGLRGSVEATLQGGMQLRLGWGEGASCVAGRNHTCQAHSFRPSNKPSWVQGERVVQRGKSGAWVGLDQMHLLISLVRVSRYQTLRSLVPSLKICMFFACILNFAFFIVLTPNPAAFFLSVHVSVPSFLLSLSYIRQKNVSREEARRHEKDPQRDS